MRLSSRLITVLLVLSLAMGCQPVASTPAGDNHGLRVLAAESFLADIAQHVAGERLIVDTLIPRGIDPHTYQPAPRDVARIAEADLLIINGAGFEAWLADIIASASSKATVIQASVGLTGRTPREGEHATDGGGHEHEGEVDPHFWLDPLNVVRYTENIRDALGAADPAGIPEYTANAAAYIARLRKLDEYIREQVSIIPPERRLLVTNHEAFGYFADRYGFTIVGTVIPSLSTDAAPSAQQMAYLVNQIRATGTRAIFLEQGANPKLAEQLAHETGAAVVSNLYTHSTTGPDGEAPGYIEMMEHNIRRIVEALR